MLCSGRATVDAFYHPERDVRIVVHGGEFVVEGTGCVGREVYLESQGCSRYRSWRPESIVILGWVVEWRKDELWWEADPRHAEKILQVCALVSGNPSVVPWVKLQEEHGDDKELAEEDLVRYRSVVATVNFITQDRSDVRVAVKELCREMARPTCASWRKLLARYLKGQPRVVQKIKLDVDGIGDEVKIIVEFDWAGCMQTRRTTNGRCVMVGVICLKAWSTDAKICKPHFPRRAQYLHNAWKKHQDAVYWVDINLVIRKGLTFYQTRSNAIILQETLPAYCVPKVVRFKTGES